MHYKTDSYAASLQVYCIEVPLSKQNQSLKTFVNNPLYLGLDACDNHMKRIGPALVSGMYLGLETLEPGVTDRHASAELPLKPRLRGLV